MRKIFSIAVVAAICFTLVVPAFAATRSELEVNIAACKSTKETCHQMAECARKLGFGDDHVIIQIAKKRWNEVDAQQREYQKQLTSVSAYPQAPKSTWTGSTLSKGNKSVQGPSGKETYYNYDMSVVVGIMRSLGYDAVSYPYWIRSDGVKMFGPYAILAANFSHYPRGSIVETSLGWGIVCDTGNFDYNQICIATNWLHELNSQK